MSKPSVTMVPAPERLAIHLDVVGGIAGDMFVAAMLDAFPELADRVLADVAAVLPLGIEPAQLVSGSSAGIAALRFVQTDGEGSAPPDHHHHGHRHHDHHLGCAHHHGDTHHESTSGTAEHATRYVDLVHIIKNAPLSENVAVEAVAILTILAESEAAIHGVHLADVHFHELADWDSLMDVVAAGSISAALAGAAWSASSLPRGKGLVQTQHGLLPVPAPATARILEGFEFRDDGVEGERVTPTGAAILRHLTNIAPPPTATGRLRATGTGAGTRSLRGMPNILRAMVFEAAAETPTDTVEVICFDVDDMTGEEIGVAGDRLRMADGVLDVSVGTRIGKKGRPLADFRVLAEPSAADAIVDLCMVETSTIGLRRRSESRVVLSRELLAGKPNAKRVKRPDGTFTSKVESDDLVSISTLAARRKAAGGGSLA